MAWSSPRTWFAGEDPPASVYNTDIRDNFKAIGDPWISYTPTWTAATTNPVIGNGTITGAYAAAGKLIFFRISIVGGSTTTWGTGVYSFTYPPFTPKDSSASGNPGITGFTLDLSATKPYCLTGVGNTSTTIRMLESSANSYMAANYPIVTPATGDKICIGGSYEAA